MVRKVVVVGAASIGMTGNVVNRRRGMRQNNTKSCTVNSLLLFIAYCTVQEKTDETLITCVILCFQLGNLYIL